MSRFSAVLLVSVPSLATLSARPQKPKREFQLQADREDFWTVFDRDAKLSAVASGFGFTEGPVWDPADLLIVSDEVANKIFRVYMDGRKRSSDRKPHENSPRSSAYQLGASLICPLGFTVHPTYDLSSPQELREGGEYGQGK